MLLIPTRVLHLLVGATSALHSVLLTSFSKSFAMIWYGVTVLWDVITQTADVSENPRSFENRHTSVGTCFTSESHEYTLVLTRARRTSSPHRVHSNPATLDAPSGSIHLKTWRFWLSYLGVGGGGGCEGQLNHHKNSPGCFWAISSNFHFWPQFSYFPPPFPHKWPTELAN